MKYEKTKYKKVELSNYEIQIILAVLDCEAHLTNEKVNEKGNEGVRRWYSKNNVNDTKLSIINQCQKQRGEQK